jgi:hypothetical protein
MACLDDSVFDEVVTRIESVEWRFAHMSQRLRLIEDRCAASHGLTYCARCDQYRGAGPCDDELCALRAGSD